MRVFGFIGALATAALVIAGFYVAGGWYDFGADSAHWKISEAIIETVRDRSIARRSDGIEVPDLTDQQLILKGAGQYAAMCTQCHLSPIDKVSDIRPGLYPPPPELSKIRVDPREACWVPKHGIKMTAMPAWGRGVMHILSHKHEGTPGNGRPFSSALNSLQRIGAPGVACNRLRRARAQFPLNLNYFQHDVRNSPDPVRIFADVLRHEELDYGFYY